jgi:hypothetical protein
VVGAVVRFLKVLVVVLMLAVTVKAGLYYDVLNLKPPPALAAGADTKEELTERVLQRFPLGSSAMALRTTLEKDSRWGPIIKDNINKNGSEFVVSTRPIGIMSTQSKIISWKTNSDDQLIDIRANILRSSLLE